MFPAQAQTAPAYGPQPGPPPYDLQRSTVLGDAGLDQPDMVTAKEGADSAQALARGHYEIMKKMPQADRLEYLKNVAIGERGREDLDLLFEARRFMNHVNRTPAKDPKAAAYGHTDRDPDLSASDATLFFGPIKRGK